MLESTEDGDDALRFATDGINSRFGKYKTHYRDEDG